MITCTHLDQIQDVTPDSKGCKDWPSSWSH